MEDVSNPQGEEIPVEHGESTEISESVETKDITAESENKAAVSKVHSGLCNQPKLHERELFIQWMCSRHDQRTPVTLKDLAIHLGVSRSTLSRWEIDPAILAEIKRRFRGMFQDKLPAAMDTLSDMAIKNGDVPSVKFMWEKAFAEEEGNKVQVNTQVNVSLADLVKDDDDVIPVAR